MPAPTVPPGQAPPWWLEEALDAETAARDAPALEGELEVDVAIVGGGYTGLWTALALRERDPGLVIAILEAEIVGWGPSGRNGGFVHGYWPNLADLRELVGSEAAVALGRAGSRIIPAIRSFCESRGADVWLREGGYLMVSAAPAQDEAVRRAAAAAAELDMPEEAVLLAAAEMAERVRSPAFREAVFFRECATIQPARLARALRSAVLEAGISLFERTRVTAVRAGSPTVLETVHGQISAPEVVMAINASATGWKPLSGLLTNFGSYVVLTEPVPELLAEIGWIGGEAVTDGRMFIHYFRTTPDGRVLMGSGSGPIGYGGRLDGRFTADAATAARAEAGLRRLLPGLDAAQVSASWGGPIDVSADHFPFFGTVAGNRIHFGAGYSGHGAGPSWLGGQILASLVLSANDEWTALPLVNRAIRRLPPEPLRHLGGAVVRSAILACERAEEEGRRGPVLARLAASIPRAIGMQVGTR